MPFWVLLAVIGGVFYVVHKRKAAAPTNAATPPITNAPTSGFVPPDETSGQRESGVVPTSWAPDPITNAAPALPPDYVPPPATPTADLSSAIVAVYGKTPVVTAPPTPLAPPTIQAAIYPDGTSSDPYAALRASWASAAAAANPPWDGTGKPTTAQRLLECNRRGGGWAVSKRPDGVYDANLGVCKLPPGDPGWSQARNDAIYYDGESFP